jgi:TolB-like protein/DNA-binding winged helix-turn-helix (wHTH) protein
LSRTRPENPAKSDETIDVGGFLFSLRTRELRDAAGADVPLRAQSAEVLALLAAAPGEVLSKDTLIDAVWPDTHVTDDSLVQCIADIRRALGDAGHRLVQTVPKRGYRLVASPPEAAPRTPTRFLSLGAALVVVLAAGAWALWRGPAGSADDVPTIAVLPFEDYSTGADKGFLSDAIAEGIITELARSRTYAVIARNSSFRYRDEPTEVRQIGADLGVDYILEGSQQKDGNRLKVTAQLISAADGRHLWANSYERDIGDLFTVQAEIILTLADRIGTRITRPVPGRDPDRVSALHNYLKGGAGMKQDFSAESSERLRDLSEMAVAIDPEAPYGYLGLAWAYRHDAVFGWHGRDRKTALQTALDYADRAIELAPEDADAHNARAQILAEMLRPEDAMASFDKAIELNPSDSDVLVASTAPLLYSGQFDEAIARIEKAKGIDPFYPDWFHWQMGWALWEKNDCPGALAAMRRMATIPPGAHRMLAGIYACMGDVENARAAFKVFYADSKPVTISEQRAEWQEIWTAPGSLDRWLAYMRLAGMPE